MKNIENQVVADDYSLAVLTGEAAFYELKEEWEELWRNSPDATQFQRWEWQYLYYKNITPKAPLRIYVVRDAQGKSAALAAFCRVRDSDSGLFKVAFLGDLSADYHLILCSENVHYSAGFQILERLFKTPVWKASYLDLSNVPCNTWSAAVVSAYFRRSSLPKNLRVQRSTQVYSVSLPRDVQSYLKQIGPRSRKDFRYDRRRLEREFLVKWQIYVEDNNLEQCLAAIEAINRARWKHDSIYLDPGKRAFLISLAQAQAKAGVYLAYVLYLDSMPAAYVTGAIVRDSYKVESICYDPNIARHLSIGKTMNFYAIEDCIQRGFCEYDLTRGSEDYKKWLGAEPRNNFHVRIYRSQLERYLTLASKKGLNFIKQQTVLRHLYQRFIRGQVEI